MFCSASVVLPSVLADVVAAQRATCCRYLQSLCFKMYFLPHRVWEIHVNSNQSISRIKVLYFIGLHEVGKKGNPDLGISLVQSY